MSKDLPFGREPASAIATVRSEDDLVLRFAELAGPSPPELVAGIGEDCAILRPTDEQDLLWTVDTLEEGIDFRDGWLTPPEIGSRSVAVALSDLAAMGGRPLALLVSLGSGTPDPGAELLGIFEGAARAARGWGAVVAGGDVTRRESGIGVSVTALGRVPRGAALRRGGARPGDEIWVTGTLGLARAGRRLLERGGRELAQQENPAGLARFVAPEPRLREGVWLRQHAPVTAAIDVSDGLALDLSRLCAASGVGARLDESGVRAASAASGRGLEDALNGGEDFEVLLCAEPGRMELVAREFRSRFDVPLRRVGEILPDRALVLRRSTGEEPIAPRGWDHLRGGGPAAEALTPAGEISRGL